MALHGEAEKGSCRPSVSSSLQKSLKKWRCYSMTEGNAAAERSARRELTARLPACLLACLPACLHSCTLNCFARESHTSENGIFIVDMSNYAAAASSVHCSAVLVLQSLPKVNGSNSFRCVPVGRSWYASSEAARTKRDIVRYAPCAGLACGAPDARNF